MAKKTTVHPLLVAGLLPATATAAADPATQPPAAIETPTMEASPVARFFRLITPEAAIEEGERRDVLGRLLPGRAQDSYDRELSDSFTRHDHVRATISAADTAWTRPVFATEDKPRFQPAAAAPSTALYDLPSLIVAPASSSSAHDAYALDRGADQPPLRLAASAPFTAAWTGGRSSAASFPSAVRPSGSTAFPAWNPPASPLASDPPAPASGRAMAAPFVTAANTGWTAPAGATPTLPLAVGPVLHAQPNLVYTKIVDTNTAAPSGSGNFTTFFGSPSVNGNVVGFQGQFGSGGANSGVYTSAINPVNPARVADNTTTATGSSSVFSNFNNPPAVSGTNVAFRAEVSAGGSINAGIVGTTGARLLAANGVTTLPNGSTVSGLSAYPTVSGTNVVFRASYSGGSGLYSGNVNTAALTRVVDRTMTAPGQTSVFTNLTVNPAVSGNNVVFEGTTGTAVGIYAGTVTGGALTRLADTSLNAPLRNTPFTGFGTFTSLSGNNAVFNGTYSGGSGIYTGTIGSYGTVLVADTSTIAPNQGTVFTGFAQANTLTTSSISGSNVAFYGAYSGGAGIFLQTGGNLVEVLTTGDTLLGGIVSDLGLGVTGLDGNNLAFSYTLTSGVKGIAVTDVSSLMVPEPGTWAGGALLLAASALTLHRRKSFRAA